MKLPFHYVFASLHFVVAVCCLLVTISIAVAEGKLSIKCGLYIEVVKKGSEFTYTTSAANSTCEYLKFMPAVVFLVSLFLMVYYLYVASFALRGQQPRFQIWEMGYWASMIVTAMFLFVASCIISTGFNKSCKQLQGANERYQRLSCKQIFDSTKFDQKKEDSSIYTFLNLAEVSCWISFLGTLASVGVSSFLIFCKRCQAPQRGSPQT